MAINFTEELMYHNLSWHNYCKIICRPQRK